MPSDQTSPLIARKITISEKQANELAAQVDELNKAEGERQFERYKRRWELLRTTANELDEPLKALAASNDPTECAVLLGRLAIKYRLEDWRQECLAMGYIQQGFRREVVLCLRELWLRAVQKLAAALTNWAKTLGLHPRPVLENFYRHTYREYWGEDPMRPRNGTFLSGQPEYDADMESALKRISLELCAREEKWGWNGSAPVKEVVYPPGTETVENDQHGSRILELLGGGGSFRFANAPRVVDAGGVQFMVVTIVPGDVERDSRPAFSEPFYLEAMFDLPELIKPRHSDAVETLRRIWQWRDDDEPFPIEFINDDEWDEDEQESEDEDGQDEVAEDRSRKTSYEYWTTEERKVARENHAAEVSHTEIGKILGRSKDSVAGFLRRDKKKRRRVI